MRAFAIRFAAVGSGAAVLLWVVHLVGDDVAVSWLPATIAVAGFAAVCAGIGHVVDYHNVRGSTFGRRDDRPWWEIVFGDPGPQRRKKRRRVFRNSASAGFVGLGLAFMMAALGLASGARFPLEYLPAAVLAWSSSFRIWVGWRRWRAGGEFNHPPPEPPTPYDPDWRRAA